MANKRIKDLTTTSTATDDLKIPLDSDAGTRSISVADLAEPIEQYATQKAQEAIASAVTQAGAMVQALSAQALTSQTAILNAAPTSGNYTLEVVEGVLQWVAAGAPTVDTVASISGTTATGANLTGTVAAFTGDTSEVHEFMYYDPLTNTYTGTGDTDTTYAKTSADIGKYIVFESRGINSSGTTISRSAVVGPIVAASVTELAVNGTASGITAQANVVGLQPAPTPFSSGVTYTRGNNVTRVAGGGFRAALGQFGDYSIDAGAPNDVTNEYTFTGCSTSVFLFVSWCGNTANNLPYGGGTGYTVALDRALTSDAWGVTLFKNNGSVSGNYDPTAEPVVIVARRVAAFPSDTTSFVIQTETNASDITATVTANGGADEVLVINETTYRGNFVNILSKTDSGTAPLTTERYGLSGSTPDPGGDVDEILWTEALDSTDTNLAQRNYILPQVKSAYSNFPTIKPGYVTGRLYQVLTRFEDGSSTYKYQANEAKVDSNAVWPLEVRAGVTPPVLRHTGTKACKFLVDAASKTFKTITTSKSEIHDRRLLQDFGYGPDKTLWIGWSEYHTHLDKTGRNGVLQFRNNPTADVTLANGSGTNSLGEQGINVSQEASARGLTTAQVDFYINGTGPCSSMAIVSSNGNAYYSYEVRSGELFTHKPIQWTQAAGYTHPGPVETGVWYDIVICQKSSQGSDGRIRLWIRKVSGGTNANPDIPMVASAPDFEWNGPTEYKCPIVQGIQIQMFPEIRHGAYRFWRQVGGGGVLIPEGSSDPNRYTQMFMGPRRMWIGDDNIGLSKVNPAQSP